MNVKKIVSEAFYKLLQKNSIEDISVSAIIEAAEISKPTFYRYYRDKYDLLNQMFDGMFSPMLGAEDSMTWGEAMYCVLTNIELHIKFLQNGVRSDDRHSLRNYNMTCISAALTGILEQKGVDVTKDDVFFAIRSCAITHTAAVVGWICDDKRMPKEQFVRLLKASLPYNLYKYFTV